MFKSTLIAKCLYQNSLVSSVEIGESAVQSIFEEYFPGHNFNKWNTDLPKAISDHFLKISKGAGTIRVDSFIKDLWNH